ncbi:hypothetical protein PIB30_012685 [Stylosanthes scabra]|uniref:Uncharacterized protein n=1 Tax=Stylosanthes scabra TaxID=79078 RepID=A0ABU6Q613_9FABA|nr:hypothetical protein [Stylosanthes scabra]
MNEYKSKQDKAWWINLSHGGVENGSEGAQHGEGQEGAYVQGVEHRRDDVAEQIQVRVAQVSDGGKWLPLPRDVREPAQQNPNHQNPAVYVQPLPQPSRHHRQRRVQVPARPVLERRKEQRPRRTH